MAKLFQDTPDLARTDLERLALADRFIERLGNFSGTARANLMAGRMSLDELQSRVSVFVADLRAEAARAPADPAVAAVPPIVDAYIKANFGSATDRMNSIIYRGAVEEKSIKREFVLFKKRPRLLRIHIVQNGLVVGVMGFDGAAGWDESPGRMPVAAVGRQADMLAASSRFDDPLVGYRERGAEVRLLDRPANGPIQLHIRESDGTEMVADIDPATDKETALRTRRSDGSWRELRLRDYRRVGPVNVAFLQEEWDAGVLHSTTRYTEVALDPASCSTAFCCRPQGHSFRFHMDLWAAWPSGRPGKSGRPPRSPCRPIGFAP